MRQAKPTQRQRVERMLREAGSAGVTNGTFAAAGILRYAARLEELRDRGLRIETIRVTGGTFRYVLHESDAGLDGGQGSSPPGTPALPVPQPERAPAIEPDAGLFAVEGVESKSYLDPDCDWDEAA